MGQYLIVIVTLFYLITNCFLLYYPDFYIDIMCCSHPYPFLLLFFIFFCFILIIFVSFPSCVNISSSCLSKTPFSCLRPTPLVHHSILQSSRLLSLAAWLYKDCAQTLYPYAGPALRYVVREPMATQIFFVVKFYGYILDSSN